MRFITVMAYDHEPYISMCKSWLYMVRKYHPTAEIIVYHHDNFSDRLYRDDVIYKKLDVADVPILNQHHYQSGKKYKLVIHKEWVKYDRFIFMDADAFPLASLQDLWNSCTKPVTFCSHQVGEGLGEKQLNSGVFVQTKPFFHYDDLIKTWEKYNKQLRYTGTDQALVQMYFEDIDYNPYDIQIMGHKYNSCANAIVDIKNDEPKAFSLIDKEYIKVIHGYGIYKFWNNPKTSLFWKWLMEKIQNG